jgi:hypothetical protein
VNGINLETFDGLREAMESLLPAADDPALPPELLVTPLRFVPTGLGGLVGLHDDPTGEIFGRRLDAVVSITVRARTDAGLLDATNAVVQAIVAAERATLRALGILSLSLTEMGPKWSQGTGGNRVAGREITASVLYEYLKPPEEAGEVIQRIPINLVSL